MLTHIICFAHCEDVEIRPAEKMYQNNKNKKLKQKKQTNKQTTTLTPFFFQGCMYITLSAINFQAQKLRQIGVPPWLQILASSTWLIKNVLFHFPTPSPTTTKIETTTKKHHH